MTRGNSNRLEFELDQPDIVLRGMIDDAPGTLFSGRLVVNLIEPIRVKGLKVVLEGHERLEWEYQSNGIASTVFHRESTPITHKWTFFTTSDGRKAETWEAGRHEFPFSVVFPGNMPETITLPYAKVSYQLKATLRRTGIMANLSTQQEISVKRDLTIDGSFGTGAIDVENRWRNDLEFRVISDADTFTPGDQLKAHFTFQPLVKHIHLIKIGAVLKEYVRCHTPLGEAEKTVSRVAASVEVVAKGDERLEESVLGRRQSVVVAGRSMAPSPGLPRTGSGVDLTHAIEEHLQLAIPADPKRLQCDHLSSYIEVTHKIKFSIHFRDNEGRPRTLWVSVPISVVPTILDTAHGPRAELPTYANAAMDQRIAVSSLDPGPPTYDVAISEPLSRASSSILSESTEVITPTDSSNVSMHSDEMAANEDPVGHAPRDRRASVVIHTVDESRPLVHPTVLHNFLRRPIVFPASAEVTPLPTPYASPVGSPQLKSSDEPFSHPTQTSLYAVLSRRT
ncbi:hypothetical protein LPJ66_005896 [Kickxella alabastrina]|uniref:Uncharacterized protein n=1 Tax=Kickxella alabastrina TaxID=61397 RepID=A0ACC1IH06_9FUNG|nr:hypothetical protein LPJ66_005896 [Kickxella alabastrina]